MGQLPPGGVERRKKLFVNKRMQSRLIGLIAAFVIIAAMLFFLFEYFGVERGAETQKTALGLLIRLLLVLILALIAVVYFGIQFSQRIAGPIYAFGRNLGYIYQGNYTQELKLRKNDEFQNLAGIFNQTLGSLKNRIQEDIVFSDKLINEIQSLEEINSQTKEYLINLIKEYRDSKEQFVVKRS